MAKDRKVRSAKRIRNKITEENFDIDETIKENLDTIKNVGVITRTLGRPLESSTKILTELEKIPSNSKEARKQQDKISAELQKLIALVETQVEKEQNLDKKEALSGALISLENKGDKMSPKRLNDARPRTVKELFAQRYLGLEADKVRKGGVIGAIGGMFKEGADILSGKAYKKLNKKSVFQEGLEVERRKAKYGEELRGQLEYAGLGAKTEAGKKEVMDIPAAGLSKETTTEDSDNIDFAGSGKIKKRGKGEKAPHYKGDDAVETGVVAKQMAEREAYAELEKKNNKEKKVPPTAKKKGYQEFLKDQKTAEAELIETKKINANLKTLIVGVNKVQSSIIKPPSKGKHSIRDPKTGRFVKEQETKVEPASVAPSAPNLEMSALGNTINSEAAKPAETVEPESTPESTGDSGSAGALIAGGAGVAGAGAAGAGVAGAGVAGAGAAGAGVAGAGAAGAAGIGLAAGAAGGAAGLGAGLLIGDQFNTSIAKGGSGKLSDAYNYGFGKSKDEKNAVSKGDETARSRGFKNLAEWHKSNQDSIKSPKIESRPSKIAEVDKASSAPTQESAVAPTIINNYNSQTSSGKTDTKTPMPNIRDSDNSWIRFQNDRMTRTLV
jgi:hypothetical protein